MIDNDVLRESLPSSRTFSEFCERIMGLLLARNLSIGSCELDGTVIQDLDEADRLFPTCTICKIASIPLVAALNTALSEKCDEARRLETEALDFVTDVLLAEPSEIATRWHSICGKIKQQVSFLPQLSGVLTEAQVNQLADRELKDLAEIMQALHAAFETGDTLKISDAVELRLLPCLRNLSVFLESCRQLVKALHS